MDSLHPSLSQALPLRGYDAEQVLQAPFRAAALGIATFYKKAAENGRKAYSLGYSSALQDVLEYLQAGLDHGTDTSKPQRSEQRMALTIERVMDYIERRQEALRAESLEPSEEDAHSTTHQPPHSATSANSITTNPQTNRSRHRDQRQAQPTTQSLDNSSHSNEAVSTPTMSSSDNLTPVQLHNTVPRRTFPARRATSANPEPINMSLEPGRHAEPSSDSTCESDTPPSASTLNILTHPINLNFNSFAAGLLPQHQHSNLNPSTNPPRRHRGGNTNEPRKGKAKERGNNSIERERASAMTTGSVQFDTISPTGYTHYTTAHPPPSGSSDNNNNLTRVLSSIGNKRRYPTIEPTGPVLEPNLSTHRIMRKSSHQPKTLPTLEEVRDSNLTGIDEMMMVLGDESLERPSKRVNRRLGH